MALVYQDGQAGKVCTKCKTWKPVDQFYQRWLSRDGYNSSCRECDNARARKWRAQNKERVAELNREYYAANCEERKAYHRNYRQEHQAYFDAYMRQFRLERPSYHREYMREWARANPDKIKEKDNARRAFNMGAKGSFTAEEWVALKQRYNHTCLRCGKREPEIKLTADHVVPISRGGAGTIDNIQPLCRPCNTAKFTQTTDYRLKWQG